MTESENVFWKQFRKEIVKSKMISVLGNAFIWIAVSLGIFVFRHDTPVVSNVMACVGVLVLQLGMGFVSCVASAIDGLHQQSKNTTESLQSDILSLSERINSLESKPARKEIDGKLWSNRN